MFNLIKHILSCCTEAHIELWQGIYHISVTRFGKTIGFGAFGDKKDMWRFAKVYSPSVAWIEGRQYII